MEYNHVPVMLAEVLEKLSPRKGGRYLDCTLGGAGYTLALAAAAGAKGQVVAIDLDELALTHAATEIKRQGIKNIVLTKGNFKNLDDLVSQIVTKPFDGIVMDLGLSSAQLDDESRGFSFKGDRPLDMAFGPEAVRSTAEIVNRYPLPELIRIFREYGEEQRAGRIARAIVANREDHRIETTGELVAIVEKSVPVRPGSHRHPATKIFQALRMETNDELAALAEALPAATKWLAPEGRLVVVSFHSGEDRIVKRFLKGHPEFTILTKRPLIPAESEVSDNPRARSAKLRAAQKI